MNEVKGNTIPKERAQNKDIDSIGNNSLAMRDRLQPEE
jgi:hypothetical protein